MFIDRTELIKTLRKLPYQDIPRITHKTYDEDGGMCLIGYLGWVIDHKPKTYAEVASYWDLSSAEVTSLAVLNDSIPQSIGWGKVVELAIDKITKVWPTWNGGNPPDGESY